LVLKILIIIINFLIINAIKTFVNVFDCLIIFINPNFFHVNSDTNFNNFIVIVIIKNLLVSYFIRTVMNLIADNYLVKINFLEDVEFNFINLY